ncbi:Arc family DNA-binding protein [Pseudomonas sp. o96-267]|uniref:Arc family DNA-binding protein n=1 Tax=Pseudomonas sp. o96-267 TaxID=2479853 RepID=UPI000F7BA2FB|nr:Arc family DNA-binding protein [Pseudomonas sp. o96-267]RRV41279.1 Arc family DNA-binding protein [Pseudomonas sp. o96-267]
MTKPDLQVNFRMPADLKAQLEEAARQNNRSTTAEVVARLQESFTEKRVAEGRMTALEIKSLMTEMTLTGTMLGLMQQIPRSEESDALTQQLIDRLDAMGDVQARLSALIDKLPVREPDDELSLEKRGNTPSPTAKRPLRKQTRPLGMDQAEWEAKRREELTVLDAGVTLDTDMEIPTTVKPERRIRRREEDK